MVDVKTFDGEIENIVDKKKKDGSDFKVFVIEGTPFSVFDSKFFEFNIGDIVTVEYRVSNGFNNLSSIMLASKGEISKEESAKKKESKKTETDYDKIVTTLMTGFGDIVKKLEELK